MTKIRAIAYYLPQFHPVPENDLWWGKGFTEWTNVVKAKPLFKGHIQPKLPADLGFYDLRLPEVREQQAELAKYAGIEGFCYWHYWFGNGKQILERPFNEVLSTGKPDFPFCLGWANHSWTGVWYGAPNRMLIEQKYPGLDDIEEHFYNLLPAFKDKRYITVDDKPLLLIFQPREIPNVKDFVSFFNELAIKNGLKGIHFVASNVGMYANPNEFGMDAMTYPCQENIINHYTPLFLRVKRKIFKNDQLKKIYRLIDKKPINKFKYEHALKYLVSNENYDFNYYHTILSGWDNSPRSGENAIILTDFNVDKFRVHVKDILSKTLQNKQKVVFIKSWNEWAEGNYLEPDLLNGTSLIEVLRSEIEKANNLL